VDKARECYVIKRGKGTGFSGVQNALFFGDNTRMIFGDAKQVCADLAAGLKQL
jgi:NAD(P) transhydrogenase subunit beta